MDSLEEHPNDEEAARILRTIEDVIVAIYDYVFVCIVSDPRSKQRIFLILDFGFRAWGALHSITPLNLALQVQWVVGAVMNNEE
jgi:hypothetical protein